MTKQKDTKIVSLADEAQIEQLLYEACRKSGWLFATSEGEVSKEEQRQMSESLDLPDDLRDPNNVWQRASQTTKGRNLTPVINEEAKENLARAARGGIPIPKDVEERMHRDRKKAEQESEL